MSADSPVTLGTERITTLDAVRGIAVMGILVMNAVAFGLPAAAYTNLDAGGSRSFLDWIIGGAGEIFADQKFLGLFSMLFGAGIVLFADRAAAKGRRSVLLSLWRNALLLVIGIVHLLFWDGDILAVYALCAPIVLTLRRLPPKVLVGLGSACYAAVAVASWLVQSSLRSFSSVLIDFWHYGDYYGVIETWFLIDYFGRALGAMLIGVALYRTGVISGDRAPSFYRRMAAGGLGIGLPLSSAGLALMAATGFDIGWAVAGTIPEHRCHRADLSGLPEPDRPMEFSRRFAPAAAHPCARPDGAHQLPQPDRPGPHRAWRTAGRHRVESHLDRRVRSDRVGGAALVVEGVAGPVQLRPGRVDVALCHLSQVAADTCSLANERYRRILLSRRLG